MSVSLYYLTQQLKQIKSKIWTEDINNLKENLKKILESLSKYAKYKNDERLEAISKSVSEIEISAIVKSQETDQIRLLEQNLTRLIELLEQSSEKLTREIYLDFVSNMESYKETYSLLKFRLDYKHLPIKNDITKELDLWKQYLDNDNFKHSLKLWKNYCYSLKE